MRSDGDFRFCRRQSTNRLRISPLLTIKPSVSINAIKGIGDQPIALIIEARKGGKFATLEDFLQTCTDACRW